MRVGECKLGGRGVMDVVSDLLASLSGELGPKKFIQNGGGGPDPPIFREIREQVPQRAYPSTFGHFRDVSGSRTTPPFLASWDPEPSGGGGVSTISGIP